MYEDNYVSKLNKYFIVNSLILKYILKINHKSSFKHSLFLITLKLDQFIGCILNNNNIMLIKYLITKSVI